MPPGAGGLRCGTLTRFRYLGTLTRFRYLGTLMRFRYLGTLTRFRYPGTLTRFRYLGTLTRFRYGAESLEHSWQKQKSGTERAPLFWENDGFATSGFGTLARLRYASA